MLYILKYTILLLLTIVLFSKKIHAQQNDSLIKREYFQCNAIINGVCLSQSNVDPSHRLFVINKPIDETGLYFTKIFYWNHEFIGFNIKTTPNLKVFDSGLYVINDSSWHVKNVFQSSGWCWPYYFDTRHLYMYEQTLVNDKVVSALLVFDIESSTFTDRINISTVIDHQTALDKFVELSDSTGIIITRLDKKLSFYELNLNNSTIRKIACGSKDELDGVQKVIPNPKQKIISYVDVPNYINVQVLYYDSIIHWRTILKRRLIEEVLVPENQPVKKYYFSKTDSREEVSILFDVDLLLESLFFDVKNDIILQEKNILSLNHTQLIFLKKMLYAKHNYKFESLYDQAYFNLFDFYNDYDFAKNRNSNVDNQLTINDKLNLLLINKVLTKK